MSTMAPDDLSMFGRFQEGDLEGQNHFFNKYWPTLANFIFYLCKDEDIARDIATDTFFKLHGRRHMIQSEAHLKSFLYTTARRACIDLYRRNRLKPTIIFRELYHLKEEDHVDFGILESDLLERVYQCWDKLPDSQREVLELYYLKEMSYEEIAALKQCKVQSVRNLRSRGILSLKDLMGNAQFALLLMLLLPPPFYTREKNIKILIHSRVKDRVSAYA